ncbi:EamA family transporter [Halorubellus sp. JP-L1]|uniref:DMT family transporter n=1 Tax=Halorubellus sp. JP-L1 TaxID=2715753 RepID=UPI001409904C|nr:EamA family transporter [Halorubellus sp. JP-L1]NHN43033.1 EamA family transporter [Halorubellus sp. JP-L1]
MAGPRFARVRSNAFALAPLFASVLWGGMYVVSKWGFASIPPVTLAALRVAVGAATLLAVVAVAYPSREFSRADWRGFGVLAVWVSVTLVTQFLGTDLTTASEGALVTVLTPVATLALGVTVLGESLTARKTGGMALALAGTGVVLASRYDLATFGAGAASGVALLVLASAGWAAYTVWGKRLVREYSALETATYSSLLATPPLVVAAGVELAVTDTALSTIPVTPETVAAVLYLGVAATAVAWYAWYKGVEYVDTGTVAVYFFAQPVVGAALGALFLDESLGVGFVVGGVVMAVGIYVVSTARSQTDADADPKTASAADVPPDSPD